MENILSLETMKEGHDGSGLGLMLKDLGGPFKDLKDFPILSTICSNKGVEDLTAFMRSRGFAEKFSWEPAIKNVPGVERRDHYLVKVYDYPAEYRDKPKSEKEDLLMNTRLAIRKMGEPDGSIFAFSFYPDVLTLKEVGDPLQLGEFFNLDKSDIKSKIVLAQGRQNTNYAIYLYACHPFFIQGYGTMTNGENTAFVPIREFLMGRGNPGYMGYNSDSEVFTHIAHYVNRSLGYPLHYYKDVITPLKEKEIDTRSDAQAIRLFEALAPAALHRRPELRHRVHARRLGLHGAGREEAPARRGRRRSRQVRPHVRGLRPGFRGPAAGQVDGHLPHEVRHGDHRARRAEVTVWNQLHA